MKKSIYTSYDELPLLLNVKQLVDLMGVSDSSIYELPFHKIIGNVISFYCFCHSSVRICFSYVTHKTIFLHQSSYFLDIHNNWWIHMQQSHIDSLSPFVITSEAICS